MVDPGTRVIEVRLNNELIATCDRNLSEDFFLSFFFPILIIFWSRDRAEGASELQKNQQVTNMRHKILGNKSSLKFRSKGHFSGWFRVPGPITNLDAIQENKKKDISSAARWLW